MTKQRRIWIKRTVLAMLLAFVTWFAYIAYFKFVIHDFKAWLVEKRLEKNFEINREAFNNLRTFNRDIGTLESLHFGENDMISFQVYDSIYDMNGSPDNHIVIGEYAFYEVNNVQFLDSNSIAITSGDTVFTVNNWIISFDGKMSDPIVEELLAYHGITIMQLKLIKQRLIEVNCIGWNKNDSLLTIRYAGHWGDSFDYIMPLKDIAYLENWNKLSNNIYWQHYVSDLFCY